MNKKRVIRLLILLVLVVCFIFLDLIIYGARQLYGQLSIIYSARPNEEYLADPAVSDAWKENIRLIDVVRDYAVDSLRLSDTDNYTEIYDQEGQPVLWVVTACEPYQFQPYEWSFPVLGSVPYKGFFKYKYAEKEAQKLKDKGLDVSIRTVNGWSTLGWFKDPILSNMLDRNTGDVADLIIHELVHATIFVKDSVEFNENLASYIAEQGALKFLEEAYGRSSAEYEGYVRENEDQIKFVDHMLRGYRQLDSLYLDEAFAGSAVKHEMKSTMIDEIMQSLDTLNLHDGDYLSNLVGYTPNNAYFMSFRRYRSQRPVLDSIYHQQFGGNLVSFVNYLKDKHGKL